MDSSRTRLPLALPATALAAMTGALGLMFLYAPTEAVQGDVQRLFYVHVPSAWLAYLAFVVVAIASVAVLVHPADALAWDRIAVAGAEVGVLFTTIVLLTGPIWGRRVWGAWWVWDARLTSTLVLWGIYAAYLLFRRLTPPGHGRARRSAVVGIVGAVDIPVIHFSVIWWRTMHPLPTVVRPGGPELPGSMLATLLVSFAAMLCLSACLLVLRIALEQTRERVDRLEEAATPVALPSHA